VIVIVLFLLVPITGCLAFPFPARSSAMACPGAPVRQNLEGRSGPINAPDQGIYKMTANSRCTDVIPTSEAAGAAIS
jgi:hypothetical protein